MIVEISTINFLLVSSFSFKKYFTGIAVDKINDTNAGDSNKPEICLFKCKGKVSMLEDEIKSQKNIIVLSSL